MRQEQQTYGDPPGMPEGGRMTAAELRVVREHLGLPIEWLARHLRVTERTIRRWERGVSPIPDGVRLEVAAMEQQTAQHIGAAVDAAMASPDPVMLTYRSDTDYRTHHPELEWPASWHRAVVARVAQEVPALVIDYWTKEQTTTTTTPYLREEEMIETLVDSYRIIVPDAQTAGYRLSDAGVDCSGLWGQYVVEADEEYLVDFDTLPEAQAYVLGKIGVPLAWHEVRDGRGIDGWDPSLTEATTLIEDGPTDYGTAPAR